MADNLSSELLSMSDNRFFAYVGKTAESLFIQTAEPIKICESKVIEVQYKCKDSGEPYVLNVTMSSPKLAQISMMSRKTFQVSSFEIAELVELTEIVDVPEWQEHFRGNFEKLIAAVNKEVPYGEERPPNPTGPVIPPEIGRDDKEVLGAAEVVAWFMIRNLDRKEF